MTDNDLPDEEMVRRALDAWEASARYGAKVGLPPRGTPARCTIERHRGERLAVLHDDEGYVLGAYCAAASLIDPGKLRADRLDITELPAALKRRMRPEDLDDDIDPDAEPEEPEEDEEEEYWEEDEEEEDDNRR